jgi:hypothetical protein
MAMSKKRIDLPGRRISPSEKPTLSSRKHENITFLIGDVVRVDVDRQKMYVNLRRGFGNGMIVDISQPFSGTSSFIQATPEEGSIVLIARQEGDMFPIAYLPNYVYGLENRNVNVWPDGIKTQNKNEFFFRIKKLKQGWISLASKEGIEVLLGKEYRLDDRSGNSFVLRPDDNAIINTSINNYVFSSGVWRNAGLVKRNSLSAIELEDTPNAFKDSIINGRPTYIIRPQNSNDPSDPSLVEYLLEVDDRNFKIKPINDVNFSSNKSIRKPVAIFSLGNFIGNNPDNTNYGKVLRPVLFSDPDDVLGDFSLEPISIDELDTYASAITILKPDKSGTGAYLGIDKEGHFYQYIPSTMGGGLGNGRSMSILARGSKKENWGKDTRYGNSWDLTVDGGIRWIVGSHNEKNFNPYSNRSIDIRTSRSVFFMYGSELEPNLIDFDNRNKTIENARKYYKIEKIAGCERKEVSSTRETIIDGSDKLAVKGAKLEKITGASTINIGSGYNVVVGDAFTEKVVKEKNESFGNRKTYINSGNSELIIKSLKGDVIEKITNVGNKILTIRAGNIEEEITVGNKLFKTNSGNYKVNTNAGNVSLSTKVGQVGLLTKSGKSSIKASMNIDIKTSNAAGINVSGGTIKLKGRMGNLGGVITSKTHLDYITGAPLRGSSTVKASI